MPKRNKQNNIRRYISPDIRIFRRNGAVLVAALFLSMILLVMGIALLTMQISQAKTYAVTGYSIKAKHFAESGMEDAKIKLQKCIGFPETVMDQDYFTYREEMADFNGNIHGIYTVTINVKNRSQDKYVQVMSEGICGDIVANPPTAMQKELIRVGHNQNLFLKPIGKRVIMAVMPVDNPLSNPDAYKYINYWDGGNY